MNIDTATVNPHEAGSNGMLEDSIYSVSTLSFRSYPRVEESSLKGEPLVGRDPGV